MRRRNLTFVLRKVPLLCRISVGQKAGRVGRTLPLCPSDFGRHSVITKDAVEHSNDGAVSGWRGRLTMPRYARAMKLAFNSAARRVPVVGRRALRCLP